MDSAGVVVPVATASGAVTVNGHALVEGDGLALSDEPAVVVEGSAAAEVIVFDLG